MLGFLWARQGEASEWPSWEDDTGKVIKSRLARVEIDPVIDRLRETLWKNYAEVFTNTGKAKTRGPLDQLESELQKIEADKEQVKQQRLELESCQRQFAELGPRLASLQDEATKLEKEANELRAQASAAEFLVRELQQRQSELDTAKERLDAVASDIEQASKLTEKLKESKAELADANERLNDAVVKESAARQRVADAQQELDATTVRAKNLSNQKERIANLLKLNETEGKRAKMEKLAKKAAAQSEALRKLQTQLNKLANVTPAKLKKLQELTASIRDHETKLEATGLTVELKPDATAKLTVTRDGKSKKLALKAGATETVRAPQNLELQLSGWGRLRIRSGATELGALVAQLAEDRESLRDQLASVECPSLSDAETAVTLRRDLEKEFKTAKDKLAETLEDFESLEELQSALATFERQAKALRETLHPTADEAKASTSALEADAERLSVAWKKEQKAQGEASGELKKRQKAGESSRDTREQADREKLKLAKDVSALEQQVAMLQARYPQRMEKAKSDAQSAFVKAEARHSEAKKNLPPDGRQAAGAQQARGISLRASPSGVGEA